MNKFKNSSGTHLTKVIFYEMDDAEKNYALYTLKDHEITRNGKKYPSLKECYISTQDPTEDTFVKTYLDGWDHWNKICKQSWFQPYLEQWREELKISLQSQGLAAIVKKAGDPDDKDHFQAAKILMTGGWIPKEHQKTGPRTKDKIKQQAKQILNQNKDVIEDFERLGIDTETLN